MELLLNKSSFLKNVFLKFLLIISICFCFTNFSYFFLLPFISQLHISLQIAGILLLLNSSSILIHNFKKRSTFEQILNILLISSLIFRLNILYYTCKTNANLDHIILLVFLLRLTECFFMLFLTYPKIINFLTQKYWFIFFPIFLNISVVFSAPLIYQIIPVKLVLYNDFFLYLIWLIMHLFTLYRFYRLYFNDTHKIIAYYLFLSWMLYTLSPPGSMFPNSIFSSNYAKIFCITIYITVLYNFFQGIFISTVSEPYNNLKEKKTNMNITLNALPIGLITLNQDLIVSFVNHYAENIIGYPKNELLNKTYDDLRALVTVKPNKIILSAQNLIDKQEFANKILRIKNQAGKKITIMLTIYYQKNHTLLFFSDASQEQDLSDLRLQTQTIMNSLSNYIFLVDDNRKRVVFNKKANELFNLPNDCNELPLSKLTAILKKYCPQQLNLINDCLNLKTSLPFELTINNENEQTKELLVEHSPIIGLDQKTIGNIFVGTDITSIKEEKNRLIQQEKLASLGQMAAGIVHEIKNPLTTIKGFNQLIRLKTTNEAILKYAETIEKEISDMNKLVNDFLDYAKPREPEFKLIPLEQLFASLEDMIQGTSLIYNITFVIENEYENLLLKIDERQIKQVILNIVKNSLDALEDTPEPFLSIRSIKRNDTVGIIIQDNGKGMDEDTLKQISTPFYTTKQKGTGLGLSVSYQIIQEHNGTIEVESAVNRGTCFKIFLPYYKKGEI